MRPPFGSHGWVHGWILLGKSNHAFNHAALVAQFQHTSDPMKPSCGHLLRCMVRCMVGHGAANPTMHITTQPWLPIFNICDYMKPQGALCGHLLGCMVGNMVGHGSANSTMHPTMQRWWPFFDILTTLRCLPVLSVASFWVAWLGAWLDMARQIQPCIQPCSLACPVSAPFRPYAAVVGTF